MPLAHEWIHASLIHNLHQSHKLRLTVIDQQLDTEQTNTQHDLLPYQNELLRLRKQILSDLGFQQELDALVGSGELYQLGSSSYTGHSRMLLLTNSKCQPNVDRTTLQVAELSSRK